MNTSILMDCNSVAELNVSKLCAVEMRMELQGDTEDDRPPLWSFALMGGRLYAMFAALSLTLPALWPVQISPDPNANIVQFMASTGG
jgi:hypothetical protein